jgi:HAD superfamily hydrolase (TIGR01509 family)
MNVRGVLLDVDGTLLDSNLAHASAWVDALADFGVHRSARELEKLVGMGSDQLYAQIGVTEHHDEIGARKKELFYARFYPTLRPQPGARALVAELRRRGLVRVVATSAGADEVDDLMRAADIYDLIERATTKNDAARSKPAPDIVESAIERAALAANELVMLGDSPYDIVAARATGVPVIAVRCGGWSDRELAHAAAIYDSPQDLLDRLDQSLFGSFEHPNRAAQGGSP